MRVLAKNGASGKDDCLFTVACCTGTCLSTGVPDIIGCLEAPATCPRGEATGAGSVMAGFSRVACLTGVGSRTICLTGVGSFNGISFTGIGENMTGGSFSNG